jgi:hypothetical protein
MFKNICTNATTTYPQLMFSGLETPRLITKEREVKNLEERQATVLERFLSTLLRRNPQELLQQRTEDSGRLTIH